MHEIPAVMSLPSTLTAKNYLKIKLSADKVYHNFSQENPKVTSI